MDLKARLEKLLAEGNLFINKNMNENNPKFVAWKNSLIRLIEKYYGKDSLIFKQIYRIDYSNYSVYDEFSDLVIEDDNRFDTGMSIAIENIKSLLDEIDDPIVEKQKIETNNKEDKTAATKIVNNINISNENKNINNIEVKSYNEIKSIIEDNTFLDDSSKEELLKVLREIENIYNSDDKKTKKWDKAKQIIGTIIDKGADITILLLPKIIEAINHQ